MLAAISGTANTPESATAAAEAKARQDFKIQDKNYIAELEAEEEWPSGIDPGLQRYAD